MKSEKEVVERLKDLLQRHRKRYIKAHLKPQGSNCAHKVWDEDKQEWFCGGCGSKNPEVCLNHTCFEPELTKDELVKAFREDICNTQRMLRDYRDIAFALWALGQFEPESDYEQTKERLLGVEERENRDTLK
jgi:hypothetical protein